MLSESQKRAIEKVHGPCVVFAGAGTGKTFTIVEKVKHIVKNGIFSPERVVCITFSNEAANNLLARVKRELDFADGREPVIKTFHSFSAQLLREYGNWIGINKNFRILDDNAAKVLMFRSFKIHPNLCHKYVDSIGKAKDLGIKIEDIENFLARKGFDYEQFTKRLESLQLELQTIYLTKEKEHKKGLSEQIIELQELVNTYKFVTSWKAYEKIKQARNYLDYSDLNKEMLTLLEVCPEVKKRYDYVIVDEFQDTNKIQLDLVFRLVNDRKVMVVGDINQSIYRFRGAYKENLSLFMKHFGVKPEEIFNLDRSFRSSNKILKAAHKLILNNYASENECFFVESAHGKVGDKIEVYEMKNAKEEARKVVELIKSETARGVKAEEICVMFRTHQQGRVIKKVLESYGIEYYAIGKASLLNQSSVRIVVDFLNIIYNLEKKRKNGMNFWWDLIYRNDFGKEDLIKIGRFIKDNSELDNFNQYVFENLTSLELSPTGKAKVKSVCDKIDKLLEHRAKPVPELVKEIYFISNMLDESTSGKEVILNLNKFEEITKEHAEFYSSDLEDFIYYLDSIDSLGIEIDAAQIENRGVRLMTSHATKGLEYHSVIITNLARKRFPIERYNSFSLIPVELHPEMKKVLEGKSEFEEEMLIKEYEMQNQLFEERRLCYVSFTRAKEKLILTYAREYGRRYEEPSQFLFEIDYTKNPDVGFEIDNAEKYEEKEVEARIKPISLVGAGDLGEEILDSSKHLNYRKKYFSPSALLTFNECEKKYEYKYVYNMPEEKVVSWEEIKLGSFVHLVLEKGIESHVKNLKDFEIIANELYLDEEWNSLNLEDAMLLIRIFYERNKGKYSEKSLTERELRTTIEGIDFLGYADRIDFHEDGIEIIDYKTGKWLPSPLNRNWQLGYYAIAATSLGKVKKVTLEMLRHEKPIEFEIDERGNAFEINSGRMSFNINIIKNELIATAKRVLEAYDKGFKPCPIEKNCEFCNEWVYG